MKRNKNKKHLRESLGLGYQVPTHVTSIGSTTRLKPNHMRNSPPVEDNEFEVKDSMLNNDMIENMDLEDDETEMARIELLKAAEYSIKLFHLVKEIDLEAWSSSKITKASDYLSSVYHSVKYDLHGEDLETDGENLLNKFKYLR